MHETPSSLREQQAGVVGASRTAGRRDPAARFWSRDLLRGLAVAAVAGAFLSFTGAFSTGDAPLGVRTAYWLGLCLGGAVAGRAVTAAAVRIGGLGARRWALALLTATVLTALLTPAVWLVTEAAFGDRPRFSRLPDFIGPVALITAAMTALSFTFNQSPRLTSAPSTGVEPPGRAGTAASESEPARFLARMPPKLRGARLFGVSSEDHYLRLHTSRGQDLILMRLSDAVAELEGLEGAQTHRSWWVARDGYDAVEREGGRVRLRLRDGTPAPVSRTYAAALRQAGWFAAPPG